MDFDLLILTGAFAIASTACIVMQCYAHFKLSREFDDFREMYAARILVEHNGLKHTTKRGTFTNRHGGLICLFHDMLEEYKTQVSRGEDSPYTRYKFHPLLSYFSSAVRDFKSCKPILKVLSCMGLVCSSTIELEDALQLVGEKDPTADAFREECRRMFGFRSTLSFLDVLTELHAAVFELWHQTDDVDIILK